MVDYLLYAVTGSDQLSGHQRLWTRHTRAAPTCRTHLRPRFEVYQTLCGLVHLSSCLPCSFYAHLLALLWSLVATDRSHCRRWGARWYRERRRGLVCGSKGNVSARQQTFKCSETRIRARNRTNMAQHKHGISERILAHRSDEQKAILRKSRPVMFVMLAFFFGLPPQSCPVLFLRCSAGR